MSLLQMPRGRFSILIVEDNKAASKIVVRMVAMHFPDAMIYTAYDGKVGVELFKKHLPNIVITDIVMPEMDGIQMAAEIKNIRSDTKFVVFTACEDGDNHEQLNQIGVHTYLLKPFDLQDLITAIEECLGGKADSGLDLIPEPIRHIERRSSLCEASISLCSTPKMLEIPPTRRTLYTGPERRKSARASA